tara:strand:+ start:2360 stop:2767 length:408 start_codon:yes stop_codon:yes gene_type:complete
MELIYFISGIITVIAVYSAVYLRSVKIKYNELLTSLQSSSNISSIRYGENVEKLDELNLYIRDVKEKMEKDSYIEITDLGKRIENNKGAFIGYQQRTNQFIDLTEAEIKKLHNEIQNTQGMIRALKEDPNFNNRY